MGDWDFEKIMTDMGVKPVPRPKGEVPSPKRLPDLETGQPEDHQADLDLFLAALEQMPVPAEEEETTSSEAEALRKLKRSRQASLKVEESLDLHGMRVEEALDALNTFVIRAFTHNHKTLMVVTGKGKHSPGGQSRMRPAVERWILGKGKRFIRAYAEAPRAHGGRGAFVLYLRDR